MLKKLFTHKTNNTYVQVFRFLFVGGAATIVDICVFHLMANVLGMSVYYGAIPIGFLCGMTVNFILSSVWVFNSRNGVNAREFIGFFAIALLGLGMNYIIIYGLLDLPLIQIPYESFSTLVYNVIERIRHLLSLPTKIIKLTTLENLMAKLIATVLVMIWNFYARKKFVYKK
ncbi:MAG: GtrA family protein [Hyphomonadaceae bacterium]|nr:GtrA family protein [Clostridia bacterium]